MTEFTNLVYALVFVPLSLLLGIKQSTKESLTVVVVFMVFSIAYCAVFYHRFPGKGTSAFAWKAAARRCL